MLLACHMYCMWVVRAIGSKGNLWISGVMLFNSSSVCQKLSLKHTYHYYKFIIRHTCFYGALEVGYQYWLTKLAYVGSVYYSWLVHSHCCKVFCAGFYLALGNSFALNVYLLFSCYLIETMFLLHINLYWIASSFNHKFHWSLHLLWYIRLLMFKFI